MTLTREQALYGAEALVILLGLPGGVIMTVVAVFPGIFVLGALPALVLAIIGCVRPNYYSPTGVTDPRRLSRRYVHVFAALSLVSAFLFVIGLLASLLTR